MKAPPRSIAMSKREDWHINEPTHAFLFAADICGFSKIPDPDVLSRHRSTLFQAVERARFFHEWLADDLVKVHFLGDEVRLAFKSVQPAEVWNFVKSFLRELESFNRPFRNDARTLVKGVLLEGLVIWRAWHTCQFFDGELPFKAQTWMSRLSPMQIAANEALIDSLKVAGVAVKGFRAEAFDQETGYLLTK